VLTPVLIMKGTKHVPTTEIVNSAMDGAVSGSNAPRCDSAVVVGESCDVGCGSNAAVVAVPEN
jgi:hypothetical protein